MLAALMRAGLLGLDLARGRAKAQARHFAQQVALGAAVLFLLVFAFSFCLAAFAVWLCREIGVVPGLGFIGAGLLVLAIIIAAAGAASEKRRRKPQPIMTAVKQEFVATEAAAIGASAPTGSTVGAMGVVALIGFLFARQLFRRR